MPCPSHETDGVVDPLSCEKYRSRSAFRQRLSALRRPLASPGASYPENRDQTLGAAHVLRRRCIRSLDRFKARPVRRLDEEYSRRATLHPLLTDYLPSAFALNSPKSFALKLPVLDLPLPSGPPLEWPLVFFQILADLYFHAASPRSTL